MSGGVGICPGSAVRTQNRSALFVLCCIGAATDSDCIARTCLVGQISSFRNTGQSFMFMAVSGIDIEDVDLHTHRNQDTISGKRNSQIMSRAIDAMLRLFANSGGDV